MRSLFIIFSIFLFGHFNFAQVALIQSDSVKNVYALRGDYYFEHHNYVKAVENYRKGVRQQPSDVHSLLLIAEAYHRSGMDSEACNWYENAFKINSNLDNKYVLKYILSLFRAYKYDELNKWLDTYRKRANQSSGKTIEYRDSTLHLIKNLKSINSKYSEGDPIWHNDELIFTSNRQQNYKHFSAVLTPDVQYENLNSYTHESDLHIEGVSATIAEKTGQLFYTTAANELYTSKLEEESSASTIASKIELPKIDNGVTHVATNSTGTLLIFTSTNSNDNMGLDLYKSTHNGKKWSKPQLLNSFVNSKSDEIYPSLHNDSLLYFASNRSTGYGGFDVYRTNMNDETSKVELLDFPINTPYDDIGLFLVGDTGLGYLSSNRPGGLGDHDLYKLYIQHLQIENERISDAKTNPTKPMLTIYVSNGDKVNLNGSTADNIEFEFLPDVEYKLVINKDDYKTKEVGLDKGFIAETTLAITDVYTFHVQKMVESALDQFTESAKIQDIHINPGDLITFQLIPNVEEFSKDVVSRIRLENREVDVSGRERLVFGYVAEEGIFAYNDTKIGADLEKEIEEELLVDTHIADTVFLTEPKDRLTQNDAEKIDSLVLAESIDKLAQNDSSSLPTNTEIGINDVDLVPIAEINDQEMPSDTTALLTSNELVPDTLTIKDNAELVVIENAETDSTPVDEVMENKELISTVLDDITAEQLPSDTTALLASNELVPDTLAIKDNAELVVIENAETGSTLIDEATENKELISTVLDDVAAEQLPSDTTALLASNELVPDTLAIKDNAELVITDGVEPDSTQVKEAIENKELIAAVPYDVTADQLAPETTLLLASEENATDSLALIVQSELTVLNDADTIQLEESVKESERITIAHKEPVSDKKPIDKTEQDIVISNVKDHTSYDDKNSLVFRVQVAAARSELNENELNRIYKGSYEVKSFNENGYNKYYIAETPIYSEAKQILRTSGVGDAFIVAYMGVQKINLVKAINMAKTIANTSKLTEVVIAQTPIDLSIEPVTEVNATEESPLQEALKENIISEENISIKSEIETTNTINNLVNDDSLSITSQITDSLAMEEKIVPNNTDSLTLVEFSAVLNDDDTSQGITSDSKVNASGIQDSTQNIKSDTLLSKLKSDSLTIAHLTTEDKNVQNELAISKPPVSIIEYNPVEEVDSTMLQTESKDETNTALAENDNQPAVLEGALEQNKVIQPKEVLSQDEEKMTDIPVNSADPKVTDVVETTEKEFVYRVQIASAQTQIDEQNLKRNFNDYESGSYYQENGYFIYYLIATNNYYEALQVKRKIASKNAIIVAYKGTEKWNIKDALADQYKSDDANVSAINRTDSIHANETVFFEFDTYLLKETELKHLNESVIKLLKLNSKYKAVVSGFTDIQGSIIYNTGLSQERANFVTQTIINAGVNSDRVTAQFFGESKVVKPCPKNEDCDETIHRANRRVEIRLLIAK